MPAPWRRGGQDRADYVVVKREGVDGEKQTSGTEIEKPTPTVRRILRRTYIKRQMPAPPASTSVDYDSDDDESTSSAVRPMTRSVATPSGPPPLLFTMTIPGNTPTNGAFAEKGPMETVVVSLQPPPRPPQDRDGRISQTTEHLLIAAGSIGATIIIVMAVLALYTMRKRGLTFSDVVRNGKNTVRRRGGGPPPPPKYGMDNKQSYDGDYMYTGKDGYPPRAATGSRSGSLSTQTPLQPLGRSDSFKPAALDRSGSMNRSFLLDDTPSRQNSHRRDISATPSSPILPIQDTRRSASTRNTRSLDGDEEALRYSDPPRQQSALPPPPSFRQFLSNRPSISQRPGLGGAMMSRFSWTNSNAPQTPHDPSRDTAIQTIAGRDSFMTARSSVPRFRTIDSWVNQQSNRVEEQRLKQQFRMTQSTEATDSDIDEVPEMPAVPKNLRESSGLPGKNIKHQRHDTIETAPIFKQHPGTEVRFSTRSTVPSEVLEYGRKNMAL